MLKENNNNLHLIQFAIQITLSNKVYFNCLPSSNKFCRLLILFVNILDTEHLDMHSGGITEIF